jgi:uncharacterized protein YneF (UPF0154 family)
MIDINVVFYLFGLAFGFAGGFWLAMRINERDGKK